MICTVATPRPRDRGQRLVAGLDRHAVGGDAALLDERVELGEERVVLDHGGRRAVQLHEVEPLDPEVLARAVVPLAEARRRVLGVLLRHAAPHLRRDERPLTGKLREDAADQALAAAVAVDVGGVDERDAGLERGLDRLDAVALADVAPVAAELPRAEADARDGPSEPWDLPLLHGGQPSGAPAVCQRFSSGARHPLRMTW